MKPINNYINERLNPRQLGPSKMFPVSGTCDEMIDFLKSLGFEQIYSLGSVLSDYPKKFNEVKRRAFFVNRSMGFIVFANTSRQNISENNPVYNINFDLYSSPPLSRPNRYRKVSEEDQRSIPLMSVKEFKSDMIKYFSGKN